MTTLGENTMVIVNMRPIEHENTMVIVNMRPIEHDNPRRKHNGNYQLVTHRT